MHSCYFICALLHLTSLNSSSITNPSVNTNESLVNDLICVDQSIFTLDLTVKASLYDLEIKRNNFIEAIHNKKELARLKYKAEYAHKHFYALYTDQQKEELTNLRKIIEKLYICAVRQHAGKKRSLVVAINCLINEKHDLKKEIERCKVILDKITLHKANKLHKTV